MNNEALKRVSYGLYVLTARNGNKDNGCIINTVIQSAVEPEMVSISVNKTNYTHDMIKESGTFTVSVIDRDADFELFEHFGFKSGRECDKFENYETVKRGKNGILYVTEGTNSYISVKVDEITDLGSHTMFSGRITDAGVISDVPSVTYEYYFENIKPKPPANKENGKTVWVCKICGYEYEGEELPEDYICPLCKHPASDFEKIVK